MVSWHELLAYVWFLEWPCLFSNITQCHLSYSNSAVESCTVFISSLYYSRVALALQPYCNRALATDSRSDLSLDLNKREHHEDVAGSWSLTRLTYGYGLLALTSVLLLCLLLLLYTLRSRSCWRGGSNRELPGPRGLPLLGCIQLYLLPFSCKLFVIVDNSKEFQISNIYLGDYWFTIFRPIPKAIFGYGLSNNIL